MTMNLSDDLGLTTCLQEPGIPAWAAEPLPRPEQLNLLRFAWDDLLAERYRSAIDRLATVTDKTFSESPSFAMRRFYYMGLAQQFLAESRDPNNALVSNVRWLTGAYRDYGRALAIALSPFSPATASGAGLAEPSASRPETGAEQVVISRRMGDCQHDLMHFEQALSCYRTAFAALERYTPGDEAALARAAIRLHNFLAREEITLCYYHYALDNLYRAEELRMRYGGRVTTQWDRATADWTQAMIYRAQSQQSGGDLDLLLNGLRLFRAVEKRLEAEPDHIDSLRRLYIQIMETRLDLAEYYRALGRHHGFKANLKGAEIYGHQAGDGLREVNDPHGKLMLELGFARLDHLSENSQHLSPRIAGVEDGAKYLKDDLLMGRAWTLRADVLLASGDRDGAIKTYEEALDRFELASARGESTRAVYGLRRAMDMI